MPLGRPAISDPRSLDLRALQTAVSNVRQRIEALEAAVQALQNVLGSASSIASLQAQITALQQVINTPTTPTETPTSLVYVEVAGDRTLEDSDFTDSLRCLVTTGNTGSQNLIIGDDTALAVEDGAAVLIYAEGSAGVHITAVSGVSLRIRDGLSGVLAGQYGAATLVKRRANEWFLTGDLAAAA